MGNRTAADELRRLLFKQLEALEGAAATVRIGGDPAAVHRFRVAARRSRALIRASEPLVGDTLHDVDRELRWFARAAAETRDLDVLLEHLRDVLGGVGGKDGGEALVSELERQRIVAHDGLAAALNTRRFWVLTAMFQEQLQELRVEDDDVRLDDLAERQTRKLVAAHDALPTDPVDDALHALRIRAKRARYAAELAARLEGGRMAPLLDTLKDLQELIGDHQDAVVAAERIREMGRGRPSEAVLFILEVEERRRRAARADLPSAWRRFERAAERAFG